MTFKRQKTGGATRAFGIVAILSLPCFPSHVCGQCQYDVIEFHAPPSAEHASPTTPSAISENGEYVVGWYRLGGLGPMRGFVYMVATSQFLPLPFPPGTFSVVATDVNDDGLIAGYYGTNEGDFGFIFDIKSWSYVEELTGPSKDGYCHAYAINSSGQVCGNRNVDDGGNPTSPQMAFLWNDDRYADLGLIEGEDTTAEDINDAGWVMGQMGQGSTDRPFLWNGKQLIDIGQLTPGLGTFGNAVNKLNWVGGAGYVPFLGAPDFRPHAFLWRNGAAIDLGLLPGHDGSAVGALNDHGTPVGVSALVLQNNTARGVIWVDEAIHNLNDLTTDPEVKIEGAVDITNTGLVLTYGDDLDPFTPNVGFILIPQTVAGDIDIDCQVDIDDLFTVIAEWGKTESFADVNEDLIVDVTDLMIVVNAWTQ